MKHLKLLLTAFLLSILMINCSSDDGDTNDLPTDVELTNIRFLNPLIIGTFEGVDECVGSTCFGMSINYDEITFKDNGDFINDRTELVTNGEITNTFGFTNTNEFIISEKESDGSTYITFQRITKINGTELIFEEFKDSDIGDYDADRIITYTMRRIN